MKHIQQLHSLLVGLMIKEFSGLSLVENKKLMMDLMEFQGIIFDRKQPYHESNYKPLPLEKDLKKVENQLAQNIYQQLFVIDITRLSPNKLLKLHEDYKTYCWYRDVNRDGKVWEMQSKLRKQIFNKAKDLKNVKEKVALLYFVLNNSNSGNPEYIEARQILEILGYSEEDIHIKEFGERPK